MTRKLSFVCCFLLFSAVPALCGDPIPVLCYHRITEDSVSHRGKLTETYRRFEEMLEFLSRHGYVSTFADQVRSGSHGTPARSIMITFDDGTRDQLRAADLLDRYGFTGLFFVVPERVADTSGRYFTSTDVDLLARRGHRIGAHGYAHRPLTSSPEELTASKTLSPDILQKVIRSGQRICDFAFPFGHYNDSTVADLAGSYSSLYTVNPGYWDGKSLLIPRMLITSDEGIEFFQTYVASSQAFRPSLTLLSREGALKNCVEFLKEGDGNEDSLCLMSVSPDAEGRLYTVHPLGKYMMDAGREILIDLKSFMNQFYQSPRRVISYALVRGSGDRLQYLSSGHTHWIGD